MSQDSSINVYSTNPGELVQTPVGAGFTDPGKLLWVDIGIHFKVVSCCNQTGRYTLISKYPPGTIIPPHRHSGRVTAITLQDSWSYLEQDLVATPGCIAYETANSKTDPQSAR